MSVTIEKPVTSVTQRGKDATTQLRTLFGFEQLNVMSTAIAEVVVAQAKQDPAFAELVRNAYQELVDLSKPTPRKPRSSQKKLNLKPIANVEGYKIDSLGPLDPYFEYKAYGGEQLPLALSEYSMEDLKEAAKKLMASHAGTKPNSFAKKTAIIEYIVEIVTKG